MGERGVAMHAGVPDSEPRRPLRAKRELLRGLYP